MEAQEFFIRFHDLGPAAAWVAAALVALHAARLWLSRVPGRGANVLLGMLAAAALAAWSVIVFDLVWGEQQTRPLPRKVALAADRSWSSGMPLSAGTLRADAMRDAIERFGEGTIAANPQIGIGYSELGDTLRPLPGMPDAVTASGATNLTALAAFVRGGAAGADAVVFYTDGITGGSTPDMRAALASLDRARAVFVALPPATQASPDVRLTDVNAEAFGFARTPVRVSFSVERLGGPSNLSLPVEVRQGGDIVATSEVELTGGRTKARGHIDLLPQRIGKFFYEIRIPSLDWDKVPHNNLAIVPVTVLRDRIRVLHVIGHPSWDERYLREVLKQNEAVDLVSFMILRTQGDRPGREEDLSLIPFPTRELFTVELPKFDVVIFQNFDYTPYFEYGLRQTLLQNISSFVRNQGGGFIMIGGELSWGKKYADSPLRSIFPFVPADDDFAVLSAPAAVQPVTPAHPLMEAFHGGRHTVRRLTRIQHVKDDAESVLAANDGEQLWPLLLLGGAGKGRTSMLLTDEIWRWTFADSPPMDHRLFWNRMLRWLVKDIDFKPRSIAVEPETVRPGQRVTVRVAAAPKDARWLVVRQHGETAPVARFPLPGTYPAEFHVSAPRTGVYAVTLDEASDADAEFAAFEPLEEASGSDVQTAYYSRVALGTGGRMLRWGEPLTPDDMARAGVPTYAVVGTRTRRARESAIPYAVILAAYCADWYVRRRKGGI